MSSPVDSSASSTPDFKSTAEFRVSTSHFSKQDLLLFVESLETIARLKRERYERRQRRRGQRHSLEDTYKELLVQIEAESPVQRASGKNSKADVTYVNIDDDHKQRLPQQDAADESNKSATTLTADDAPLYENVAPAPRSRVLSQSKFRSMRARLIALILKRKHSEPLRSGGLQRANSTALFESDNRYERVLNDMIRQQHESMATRFIKRKLKRMAAAEAEESADVNFLDKALRYLTL